MQSLIITSKYSLYSVISHLHNSQFTVAHHLPVSDLYAPTVNSLTLQIFHVNLLFTEAVFSTHADNSLRTRTKVLILYSALFCYAGTALPSVSLL
jgi:hypothetical protein